MPWIGRLGEILIKQPRLFIGPAPLAAIVHRMLGKLPDERFTTPNEIVEALAPFCDGAELGALLGTSETSRKETRSATTQVATRVATKVSAVGKSKRPLAVALSFGGAALVALAVILAITTRHGTVVIESPDGKLPADVRVAVSQGGEEVAVLQADNHWSAKVVNGEYQLQVRVGDDRFELADQKVNITRLGNKGVELHVKKSAAEPKRADAANTVANNTAKAATPSMKPTTSTPPSDSKPAVAAERPFVLMRDGQQTRAFRSLTGAIANQKAGDVIEVRSNDSLVAELPTPMPESLSIRAGAGFRPHLQFKAAVPSPALSNSTKWNFQGCLLDLRQHSFASFHPECRAECQLTDCGIWGGNFVGWSKIAATNCIFVMPMGGFNTATLRSSEIVLENCALQNRHHFFHIGDGEHKITLRHCTYYEVDGYTPDLIHVEENAKATVEASHCVFHRDSQNPNLIPPQVMPRVTWNGNDNCFSGRFCVIGEAQPDGSWKTLSEGLAAWKKQLKGTERDSIERPLLTLEWGRIQRLGEDRLAEIARAMRAKAIGAEANSIGPEWSLVGAGDAYVRALAAAGRPVAEGDLRPEQIAGGPFTLLVEGSEPRGFPSIVAAFAAASEKTSIPAVIEIRSDGPFPLELVEGKSRRIVLRAAPGYRPLFESLVFTDGAQVELEGIAISQKLEAISTSALAGKNDDSKTKSTKLIRAMNCEFVHANTGAMTVQLESDIMNCNFGHAELLLDPTDTPAIRNSVGFTAAMTTIGQGSPPAKLTIDRCLFFLPEQPIAWIVSNLTTRNLTRIDSHRSIYIAPTYLIGTENFVTTWTGDENWFSLDATYVTRAAPVTLDELRKLTASDTRSRELLPWQFDPSQWKILADDITQGADVKQLGTAR